jgi:NTP-dependent ternary system trypsin peptidase co-occuring protein
MSDQLVGITMNNSTSVPLRLPNQSLIRVEATFLKRPGDTDVAFSAVEKVLEVSCVQEAIEGIGELVIGALKNLAPRKASAEFAIEVGLESGQLTALWVKGTGKANLKITLEWTNDSGSVSAGRTS